jgi:hypothetical protein
LYFSFFDILSIVLPSDKLKTEHLTRSERIVLAFLGRQTKFFRSQLGLPEENSDEFEKMMNEMRVFGNGVLRLIYLRSRRYLSYRI